MTVELPKEFNDETVLEYLKAIDSSMNEFEAGTYLYSNEDSKSRLGKMNPTKLGDDLDNLFLFVDVLAELHEEYFILATYDKYNNDLEARLEKNSQYQKYLSDKIVNINKMINSVDLSISDNDKTKLERKISKLNKLVASCQGVHDVITLTISNRVKSNLSPSMPKKSHGMLYQKNILPVAAAEKTHDDAEDNISLRSHLSSALTTFYQLSLNVNHSKSAHKPLLESMVTFIEEYSGMCKRLSKDPSSKDPSSEVAKYLKDPAKLAIELVSDGRAVPDDGMLINKAMSQYFTLSHKYQELKEAIPKEDLGAHKQLQIFAKNIGIDRFIKAQDDYRNKQKPHP